MKIEFRYITVRELANSYFNNTEDGSVSAYGGKLNIRPPYQREFVYKDKQRDAVIESVLKNYPLNVMYWVVNGENDYEVLDGQQRSIALCEYVKDGFAVNNLRFSNLPSDKQEQIFNYKLFVYFCEGTDSEKLEWFNIVNIAGERLTQQEIRNAVYHGTWLSSAKVKFSKKNGAADKVGGQYLNGSPIRQEYLETVLSWISGGNIERYMSEHQHDSDAKELWQYFDCVIQWVNATFPTYRGKLMKGLPWGEFYNEFKNEKYNPDRLEERIKELIEDEEITKQKGIYEYLLSGESKERCLSIRSFTEKDKRRVYEKQQGICPHCKKQFGIEHMEADHITPWHEGGKTTPENCQMLCKECNRRKAGK
ncbi:MAG: DUF262 domain-containing protein [Planctomycetaceae bacterium]|nr:DUF262 domain-containing protein [Planctomycetaceae bacterium]